MKYAGRWDEDEKSGYGKEYDPNKNEYYQGEYDCGFRDGKGRLINNELQVWDAEFRRGEIHTIRSLLLPRKELF